MSHRERLNCKFEDFDSRYTCVVSSLDNTHNNLTIYGNSGEHKANKNDADVKRIWIQNTDTKYIPTNLGSLFNLTALRMWNTQLIEIKAKDFHGMQDLQYLSLKNNKLKSVPLDAFATLTKLRFISLESNQIEELSNDIFSNNLVLETIFLSDNNIKYLGTEIFNSLEKLDWVCLYGNICVNKNYRGKTEINQLKKDIKMKCKNPNEFPATTSTTETPNAEGIEINFWIIIIFSGFMIFTNIILFYLKKPIEDVSMM